MPDVGKYDKRDKSAAEVLRLSQIGRIAVDLGGELAPRVPVAAHELAEHALWLFCVDSGFRRITDLTWFHKHMEKGETVAQFRARLWCDGCRRQGCLTFLPCRYPLGRMPLDLRRREVRDLFIRDHFG